MRKSGRHIHRALVARYGGVYDAETPFLERRPAVQPLEPEAAR